MLAALALMPDPVGAGAGYRQGELVPRDSLVAALIFGK